MRFAGIKKALGGIGRAVIPPGILTLIYNWKAEDSSTALGSQSLPTEGADATYILESEAGEDATGAPAGQYLGTAGPTGGPIVRLDSSEKYTTGITDIPTPCTLEWYGKFTTPGSDQMLIGDPTSGAGIIVGADGIPFGYVEGTSSIHQQTITEGVGSFGSSIDYDGVRLISGDPANDIVYIYTYNGTIWELEQSITTSDISSPSVWQYGTQVAISGDRCAIGAINGGEGGGNPVGAVYTYTLTAGVWGSEQKLTTPAPEYSLRPGFYRPRMNGTELVISAYESEYFSGDLACGRVFIYTDVGGTWTLSQTLISPDAPRVNYTYFGIDIDLKEDLLIVGQRPNAHIYRKVEGVWSFEGSTGNGATGGGFFGEYVAIDGDRCVVAEYWNFGRIHAYEYVGGSWTNKQTIIPSNITNFLRFGYGLSLSGDKITVGGPRTDSNSRGSAYVYTLLEGTWGDEELLTASVDPNEDDNFGIETKTLDGKFFVGASGTDDSVYVYEHGLSAGKSTAAPRLGSLPWDDDFHSIRVSGFGTSLGVITIDGGNSGEGDLSAASFGDLQISSGSIVSDFVEAKVEVVL